MTDYYQNNYRDYFDSTIGVDPSAFLEPLAGRLKEGATVLDVGCGSGRDLAWMKDRGFQPLGFEGSSNLARLARETSGCEVIEGDFEIFDFSRFSVDAILLVTALVHVPHDRLAATLTNITHALKPGGWLLISLKEGTGCRRDEKGRIFYCWQAGKLKTLLSVAGFDVIKSGTMLSALQTGDPIINLLAQNTT